MKRPFSEVALLHVLPNACIVGLLGEAFTSPARIANVSEADSNTFSIRGTDLRRGSFEVSKCVAMKINFLVEDLLSGIFRVTHKAERGSPGKELLLMP